MSAITYTESEHADLLEAVRELEQLVIEKDAALDAGTQMAAELLAENQALQAKVAILRIKAAAYDHMLAERNTQPSINECKLYEGYHAEL